jgi:hypothetical protein
MTLPEDLKQLLLAFNAHGVENRLDERIDR